MGQPVDHLAQVIGLDGKPSLHGPDISYIPADDGEGIDAAFFFQGRAQERKDADPPAQEGHSHLCSNRHPFVKTLVKHGIKV